MPKKSIARRGIAHWQINKQGNGDHLLVFWKESIASITQANSDGLGPVGMGAHSEKKHWILSHYLYKHRK